MRIILIILDLILLSGCTVGYYRTHGELNTLANRSTNDNCNFKYIFSVKGGHSRSAKFGKQIRDDYAASIEKVFKNNKCNGKQVTKEADANLLINIELTNAHDALAQEFLTGLSIGLIPSWGARRDEFSNTVSRA